MCEFTVILYEDGKENQVARDIIRTTYKDGELILIDILGDSVSVGGALIREVNVDSEVLKVHRHKILGNFLRFLEIYERCRGGKGCGEELVEAWEKVKSIGDSMIEEFSRRK
ncbi:MAG: hypothetical protein DRO05_00320 [Thermoproteota archaeon]|nr:MAG: hypothetical protein DRO05_00320 [Candidatus Korarchaeota archaeon]